MTLSDLDDELLLCQNHLNSSINPPKEIEFYLTQFLIVRICGQYEKEIQRIVNERASKTGDSELASFVTSRVAAYKHLDLDQLRGNVLSKFSPKYLDKFNSILKGTLPELSPSEKSQTEISYTSIVSNRHSIAHGGSITLTLNELIKAHSHAKKVLDALSLALS